jgi:hypothetical protein
MCLRKPVDRIENESGKAACFIRSVACFCLLLFVVNASISQSQGTSPAEQAPQKLDKADLLGFLVCATRPDQLLAVRADSYGGDNFSVRYMYPVLPGREANQLNTMHPANWAAMLLYNRDARYAALFEVAFDGPPTKRTYILLDGANLENQGARWVIKGVLNGGASTWPEIVSHVDRLSTVPLVTISSAAPASTKTSCEFPTAGMTFSATSITGSQSNWKFRGGVSEGIRLTSHLGPFHNSDLKRVPSAEVYINTYGP